MSKTTVPAPPEPARGVVRKRGVRLERQLPQPPLDGQFLRRTYRANFWFGMLLAATIGIVTGQWTAFVSCLAGSFSGILLFKSSERFVERVFAAKQHQDARSLASRWMVGPGKFALIALLIWQMREQGIMNFGAFVTGCAVVQCVVLTMATGNLLGRRNAAQSLNEIYVRRHLKKKRHA